MKFDIKQDSHANITFNNSARVTIHGEFGYTVKWYCNNNFCGQMDLGGSRWGSFPLEIGNWKIEFWEGDNLVNTYYHQLKETFILIIAHFKPDTSARNMNVGKIYLKNFSQLGAKAKEIAETYGCGIVYYYPGSETFPQSHWYQTLKMNDNYDFSLITELEF